MLAQVKGIVRGNTVIVEDDDILGYEGKEVIVTFLDYAEKKTDKPFDIKQFVNPTERGNCADDYVRELRDNDRF